MNANTRVAINAMATYGRTLLRMGLGLFSSRWVLESLGEVDYGLMGVVGSLIVLATFLNTVVTGACARFFAFSIGKKDIIDLRKWFNTGLSVHLALAIFLVVIFAPVGEWAIGNFLNIPPDRLEVARWIYRISLVGAFWTICATPFVAMYTATQNITELTLWEVASIITNFGFVYWLTTYKGDAWFMYSAFSVGLTFAIGVGQVIRAHHIYSGCHINLSYWGDWNRIKQMFSFSAWTLFGNLGYMAKAQMPSVLLNQFFNPLKYAYVNASYQVGGSLAGYTQSMSSSLMGAFTPQITTLAGANNHDEMIRTALRSSKFGTLLTLLFAIPLSIEADYLLQLWLKNPPILASGFCRIVLVQMVLDNLTFGQMSGIMASGRIKWYQITTGLISTASIPIAWGVLAMGGSPLSMSWTITICVVACSIARLFFGQAILNIRITEWVRIIFIPLFIVTLISSVSGILVNFIIEDASFFRLCATTFVSVTSMSVISWFLLFDSVERLRIKSLFGKIVGAITKFAFMKT